jgi:hypothetical protein
MHIPGTHKFAAPNLMDLQYCIMDNWGTTRKNSDIWWELSYPSSAWWWHNQTLTYLNLGKFRILVGISRIQLHRTSPIFHAVQDKTWLPCGALLLVWIYCGQLLGSNFRRSALHFLFLVYPYDRERSMLRLIGGWVKEAPFSDWSSATSPLQFPSPLGTLPFYWFTSFN